MRIGWDPTNRDWRTGSPAGRVLDLVAQGATVSVAAPQAGLSSRTVGRWITDGDSLDVDPDVEIEDLDPLDLATMKRQFCRQYRRLKYAQVPKLVNRMEALSAAGNFRATRYLLEQADPEAFLYPWKPRKERTDTPPTFDAHGSDAATTEHVVSPLLVPSADIGILDGLGSMTEASSTRPNR